MPELLYADLWETVAAAVPGRTALIRGDRSVTWRELDRHANALARYLLDAGLGRGAKVAAYLYNAPEYLETYYAAFKAGLTPFNTNYRYGADELLYLFDNADAEAVVFHASFAPVLARVRARLPQVKAWIAVAEPGAASPDWAVDYDGLTTRAVPRVEAPWGRSPDDLLLMYTGGTTGMPKGVMWRQADLFVGLGAGSSLLLGLGPLTGLRDAAERAQRYDQPDAPAPSMLIPVAPLMHATGLFLSFAILTGAGTIAALPSNRFDAEELWDEVERRRASSIVIVGMAFAVPMLEVLDASPGRWDLSSLRRIMSSGTIWSTENKQALLKHMPHVMMIDTLGSSEALGVGVSAVATGMPAETARFMAGAQAAVFSEDGRRIAPGSGERGLLANAGPNPIGYYKDPIKSAATFRTFEGALWSVPGDWATLDADGSIRLLGRGSQVINTGGEKVFPEEVEEVLKRYPGVRDAAVIGLPDPRFGERICAIVELSEGVSATLEQLSTHVKASLAAYKAPRELLVLAIPRQPNGKLDYASVRARAIAELGS